MILSRKLLGDAATGVLVGCAVLVTVLLARRELVRPSQAPVPPAPPARVADWRAYASGGHLLGRPAAPDTVVEFSDFECPACRAASTVLSDLRARRGGGVLVVYRHFPLAQHPYARAAARAAECAAEQGRFEAMHDALFAAQPELGRVAWTRIAVRAGVGDTLRFAGCMAAPRTDARIAADAAAGRRLGVRATPTLIVNGHVFEGIPEPDSIDHLLAARARPALAGREPSVRGPQ